MRLGVARTQVPSGRLRGPLGGSTYGGCSLRDGEWQSLTTHWGHPDSSEDRYHRQEG